MTITRKYKIYDLHPCKFHSVPPMAFKFDPVKFSETFEKLKQYFKTIKK